MDYEAIDREMTNELYRDSVWVCHRCGGTRPVENWRNFTSQNIPDEPCKLCGHYLEHGIVSNDGSGRVGLWFPRDE